MRLLERLRSRPDVRVPVTDLDVREPDPWIANVRVYNPAGQEVAFGSQRFEAALDSEAAIDKAVEDAIEALYYAREQAKLGMGMMA